MMGITTRFTEMFQCQYPLQQAGMGGFATPDLAIAVAQAGGLGMLSGTIGAEALAAQLDIVPVGVPVGVNFLVPFLDRAALEDAATRSPLVECFWGAPDPGIVASAHECGARAGWQVGSADEARAACDAGCDLIVAQGIEAGGHVRGTVGLLALLDEVRAIITLPIVAAGGIGTGRAMAAALAAGADAVRVGTRFVASSESTAHPTYIDALIRSGADDTVLTTAFGEGWPDAPIACSGRQSPLAKRSAPLSPGARSGRPSRRSEPSRHTRYMPVSRSARCDLGNRRPRSWPSSSQRPSRLCTFPAARIDLSHAEPVHGAGLSPATARAHHRQRRGGLIPPPITVAVIRLRSG